ncbi:MAG: DUF507 family protein [Epsilonproteobacteria bacterium]|nr:DUF507 family protein [Campylobacterota bacterium]
MLIKEAQVPFISRKIAYDLLNSGFVTFPKGIDNAIKEIEEIVMDNVLYEKDLEDEVREIISQKEEENEYLFYDIDRREFFKLLKKEIAQEEGFPLRKDERFDELSSLILKNLWDKELIDYDERDGRIKNIIFKSLMDFFNQEQAARDEVFRKIENYKRPLIPGTEEWEIVFERLYEHELRRRGLL